MKSLKFNQLLVMSNSLKSANQFKFKEHLNLITADDNSVGKSTLVKLLFWGLGCEPALDNAWESTDCQTLVEFSINNNKYKVKRYKNIVKLKENDDDYIEYEKITGEFSIKMAQIFEFKALLKSYSNKLETPPPAFYFLPFYIDQKKSWANAWGNFENLTQYASWKNSIIKYHVGLLSPAFFEFETSKFEKKDEKNEYETQIDKIDTALEIVEEYIPETTFVTLNKPQFEELTDKIKAELIHLQTEQETKISELAYCQGEKVYLEQQKALTVGIINELDADYKFSIENVNSDEIECPLCGIVHENTIVNRSSILTDKAQAENQLTTIQNSLGKIEKRFDKVNKDLILTEGKISILNEKFTLKEKDEVSDTSNIIESIAGNSIKQKVIKDKEVKIIEVDKLQTDIKEITKEQKKLISKEETEIINNKFLSLFQKYIEILEAEAVNLSDINSPLDYNKVIKEGGAAEGSRAILAYYLAIYKMVGEQGNEVNGPIVIDTPNQQEQSDSNYANIVTLLTQEIDNTNQVILCAMENEHVEPFKKTAHIIKLGKDKLLSKEKFELIKKEYNLN
jgi:hypothetical protein